MVLQRKMKVSTEISKNLNCSKAAINSVLSKNELCGTDKQSGLKNKVIRQ